MDLVSAHNRAEWREWLEANHSTSGPVWLVLQKKHTGKVSIQYEEAVEEALCYGWVDNAVRRLDADTYAQRFAPRKKGSRWSNSNIERMEKMLRAGRVTEAGMDAYPEAVKEEARSGNPQDLDTALRADPEAMRKFQALAPSHKAEYLRWIADARRPATRAKRIAKVAEMVKKSRERRK